MSDEDYKYWAFISYSHADEAACRWLHKALEGYRIPPRLVGQSPGGIPIPKKLFPIFRDRDELAGSPELGPDLQRALQQSRTLIAICSPRAARSHWVNEEILHFKKLGRANRVFALIVSGEPMASADGRPQQECFPAALRFQIDGYGDLTETPAEPIAADLRRHGDGRSNAKLKLISGILGVGFDELRQRELQARNRRLMVLSGLAATVAGVTLVLAIQAYQARNEAQRQQAIAVSALADAERRQHQAEDLIEFMLGDLREKLEPIGRLSILDSVGTKAMDYFATLDDKDRTDAVLASRATALRQIGGVRLKQGDLDGATRAFAEALKLDSELVERHPEDLNSISNVGESQFSVGYAYYAKGRLEEALPWMQRYSNTADRLLMLDPKRPESLLARVHSQMNLGAIGVSQRRFADALAHFQSARGAQATLLADEPDQREYISTLSGIYAWLAYLHGQARDWGAALDQSLRQVEQARTLLALEPDNAAYRQDLVKALHFVLHSQGKLTGFTPTSPELREALTLTAELRTLDPENVEYGRAHWVSLTRLADAQIWAGELQEAAITSDTCDALSVELLRRAPENARLMEDFVAGRVSAIKLAMLRTRPADARAVLQQTLSDPVLNQVRRRSAKSKLAELHLLAWALAAPEQQAVHEQAARDWFAESGAADETPAELRLRFALLAEQPAVAREAIDDMSELERRDPHLRLMCRARSLCGQLAG